jgi:hypothetical protein
MSKKKYYIWSPDYDPHSGGIMALHRLAHNLGQLGEDCYLITNRINPKFKTKILNPYKMFELQNEDAILIYPEIISGNPLKGKQVIRWILNTPGAIGGDGNYEDRDLIFKFNEFFQVNEKYKISGLLTAYENNLDFWVDQGLPRSGTCYMVKKGSNKPLDKHPKDAYQIDGWEYKGGNELLLKIFNQYEYFICYDPCTYTNVIASLCGCIPIVIPDENKTIEDWYSEIPIYRYGIAYGFDDIERAKSTRSNLIDMIKDIESTSIEQTKKMIEICENKK